MASDSQQLIETLTAQFRELITDNWLEFWSYRDPAREHKGTVSFSIDCRRQDYVITSGFAFGIRINHKTSAVVNSQQTLLNLDGANGRAKDQKTAL